MAHEALAGLSNWHRSAPLVERVHGSERCQRSSHLALPYWTGCHIWDGLTSLRRRWRRVVRVSGMASVRLGSHLQSTASAAVRWMSPAASHQAPERAGRARGYALWPPCQRTLHPHAASTRSTLQRGLARLPPASARRPPHLERWTGRRAVARGMDVERCGGGARREDVTAAGLRGAPCATPTIAPLTPSRRAPSRGEVRSPEAPSATDKPRLRAPEGDGTRLQARLATKTRHIRKRAAGGKVETES